MKKMNFSEFMHCQYFINEFFMYECVNSSLLIKLKFMLLENLSYKDI